MGDCIAKYNLNSNSPPYHLEDLIPKGYSPTQTQSNYSARMNNMAYSGINRSTIF
ncbi:MAG: hypothetical protein KKF50_01425 [Nanoarchaeota archaeon]|nr:hypothetical protein [Nanoarchaeota archaeon]